jgi:hypothetical protein
MGTEGQEVNMTITVSNPTTSSLNANVSIEITGTNNYVVQFLYAFHEFLDRLKVAWKTLNLWSSSSLRPLCEEKAVAIL